MNQIEDWIRIAKSDLKTAQILYKSKRYSGSFYSFQQASEKANKALAAGTNKEQVIEQGHDQLKFYRKQTVKGLTDIRNLHDIFKSYPILGEHELFKRVDTVKYEKSLDTSLRTIDKLRNKNSTTYTTKDLNDILIDLKRFTKGSVFPKMKMDPQFSKDALKRIQDFFDLIDGPTVPEIKKSIDNVLNDSETFDKILEFQNKMLHIMPDLHFIQRTFFYCALITTHHSSSTRYTTEGKNPIDVYTWKLPIVRKQPEFMALLGLALKKFSRIMRP